MKYYGLLLFSIILCLPVTELQAQSDEQNESVEAFFQLSGLEVQIRELPGIILSQFEDEIELVPVNARDQIREEITKAFDPDTIVEDARTYLLENLDSDNIKIVVDWLQEPLTQKMNQLEMDSNDDISFAKRDAFFQELEFNPPTESRLDLLNRLESSTDATYYLVSIITDMYLSLIRTINPYLEADKQLSNNRIAQMRTTIMGELTTMYQNITHAMNLFTYRDVTDSELEEYVAFYETPAGKWFADVSYDVIESVLQKSNERLTENRN